MNASEEALKLVTTDRQKDYGHPYDDFSRTVGMMNACGFCFRNPDGTHRDLTPEDFPLIMTLVKISRQVNHHKWDNIVDIHGYMRCLELVMQRKAELNPPTYCNPCAESATPIVPEGSPALPPFVPLSELKPAPEPVRNFDPFEFPIRWLINRKHVTEADWTAAKERARLALLGHREPGQDSDRPLPPTAFEQVTETLPSEVVWEALHARE